MADKLELLEGPDDDLQQQFEAVLSGLAGDKSLEKFKTEYEKLLGALKKSHGTERKLLKKVKELNDEIVQNAAKVQQALRLSEEDQATIEDLRKQVERAWGLVEAASTREEAANQNVERLTAECDQMKTAIGKYTSLMGEDTSIEDIIAARESYKGRLADAEQALVYEKSRSDGLVADLNVRNQRYKEKKAEAKELERQLAAKTAEEAKALRARSTLEGDLSRTRDQLGETSSTLDLARKQLAEAEEARRIVRAQLDAQQKAANATLSENHALKSQVQRYMEEIGEALDKAEKDKEARAALEREVKAARDETARERSTVAKLTARIEAAERDRETAKKETAQVREELSAIRAELAGASKDLSAELAHAKAAERTVARLDKEKAAAEKLVAAEKSRVADARAEASEKESEKTALENEVRRLMQEAGKLKAVIGSLERDRERMRVSVEDGQRALAHRDEDVRMREAQITELERREAELGHKLKAAQALYESMRGERNAATKSLLEAQEEIAELRRKSKVQTNQVEQLKEDVHSKDRALVAEQFEATSMAKRVEARAKEVEQLRKLLEEASANVARQGAELSELNAAIRRLDTESMAQKRAFDTVVAERDNQAEQLTRKNDELALLTERHSIMSAALSKGEAQYSERLEDIRTLKLAVGDMKRQLALAAAQNASSTDLKRELVALQRDLLNERGKIKALEEELEQPMNVHRWRRLEGNDPEAYEALQKCHALQRRLISKTEEVVERDLILADKEKLIAELKGRLAAAPGPELTEQLTAAQHMLNERTRQLKALASEANMARTQAAEARYEVDRLTRDLAEMKRSYYELRGRTGGGGGGLSAKGPGLSARAAAHAAGDTGGSHDFLAVGGQGVLQDGGNGGKATPGGTGRAHL